MEHVQVFYSQEHSEMVMKSGAGICRRGKAWQDLLEYSIHMKLIAFDEAAFALLDQ